MHQQTRHRYTSHIHVYDRVYDEAEKNLVELYAIVSDIESPTAQDVYSGLMGMVTLFRGDAEGALDQFSENINT